MIRRSEGPHNMQPAIANISGRIGEPSQRVVCLPAAGEGHAVASVNGDVAMPWN